MDRFVPIWPENPDFSKSSAGNISRRNCAPNVHVIEAHVFVRLSDEVVRDLWLKLDLGPIWACPGMIMSDMCRIQRAWSHSDCT